MDEWIEVCRVGDVDLEDVLRFDHGDRTFAVYRSPDDAYFVTDGLCTHAAVHLADGLVMDATIECPLHHGVFDYVTGEALAPPVCEDLRTYEVRTDGDVVRARLGT